MGVRRLCPAPFPINPQEDNALRQSRRACFEAFDPAEYSHLYQPDFPPLLDNCAACSNSETRTSMSSTTIAFIVWFITHSAARTRLDVGTHFDPP